MTTSFISWNVNGIRAMTKKGFLNTIKELSPDFLLLQETKAPKEETLSALSLLSGYECHVNSSKSRKGYSGTAVLSRIKPIKVNYDLGIEEHDQEGRVVTLEFDAFYLVGVYVPNAGERLKRLDYRKEWDLAFGNYLGNLDKQKPVIVGGDFNVAHKEIDIARAKQNYDKSAGYTQAEIDGFEKILDLGLADTFRNINPEEVSYSYWNYIFNSRERNVGWRIDYFLVSQRLVPKVKEASILSEYFGSDHCPVAVEIEI